MRTGIEVKRCGFFLQQDITRIDAALTEYAQAALDRGASKIAQGSNVSYTGKAKRRTA